jgi:ketosteroid isomerase-like protein
VSRENVEIVRRAFEAWNSGEPDAAAGLLDPGIEWHLPENFPDAGTWRGKEQVLTGLAGLADSWEGLVADVRELIDAGDRVVALVRYHGRAAVTGLDLEGVSVDAQVWTLRDGTVVEVRMYGGTDEALAAAGVAR